MSTVLSRKRKKINSPKWFNDVFCDYSSVLWGFGHVTRDGVFALLMMSVEIILFLLLAAACGHSVCLNSVSC